MEMIIPNWHPIFVQFTIALICSALLFMLLIRLVPNNRLQQQWRAAARWNLWLGSFATLFTLISGLYAYGVATPNALTHPVMLVHRNWALVSCGWLAVVVVWSAWCCNKGRAAGVGFLSAMVLLVAMLLSTAWHGARLTYHDGLGAVASSHESEGRQSSSMEMDLQKNQKETAGGVSQGGDGHFHDGMVEGRTR